MTDVEHDLMNDEYPVFWTIVEKVVMSDIERKPPGTVEHLPNGRIRIWHGPPSDKCPMCGGKGKTSSSFMVCLEYTEHGPELPCEACRGTGKIR